MLVALYGRPNHFMVVGPKLYKTTIYFIKTVSEISMLTPSVLVWIPGSLIKKKGNLQLGSSELFKKNGKTNQEIINFTFAPFTDIINEEWWMSYTHIGERHRYWWELRAEEGLRKRVGMRLRERKEGGRDWIKGQVLFSNYRCNLPTTITRS